MAIFQVLQSIGLPVAYGFHSQPVAPPYLTYMGAGQDRFEADNTYYTTENRYEIEYCFKRKDPATEDLIESTLLANGYKYDKSEDTYADDEGVFIIYYDV